MDALINSVGKQYQRSFSIPDGIWAALHYVLLIGFLAYTFIGTKPLGVDDLSARVDGNILDRLSILFLFCIAGLSLLYHWRQALFVAKMNSLLTFVVLFCVLSFFWSYYPDLTLRRSLLLFFLTVIALAIAVGTPSLRALHTTLTGFLFAVILINWIATLAVPGFAITDIGVRGIYSQKNVAGFVAMFAVIVTLTWIFGTSSRTSLSLGLIALVPAVLFLLASRSKTSLGLTILAVSVIILVQIARRIGPVSVHLALVLVLFGASAGIIVVTALDFDLLLLIDRTIGDVTFSGRDELWQFAIRSIGEAPWLGHGYGAFWDVGDFNDPTHRLEPGTWLGDVEPGVINQAHNGYLELALHIGIPATILAVIAVLRSLAYATYRMTLPETERGTFEALLMFSVLLGLFLLHNLLEASLLMRGIAFSNLAVLCMVQVTAPTLIRR